MNPALEFAGDRRMMDAIRDKCIKLRPVIGDKLANVIFVRYTIAKDIETKKRWEKKINVLYARYLNDELDLECVNLPPPAGNILTGEYHIGQVLYCGKPTGQMFGIRENECTSPPFLRSGPDFR